MITIDGSINILTGRHAFCLLGLGYSMIGATPAAGVSFRRHLLVEPFPNLIGRERTSEK